MNLFGWRKPAPQPRIEPPAPRAVIDWSKIADAAPRGAVQLERKTFEMPRPMPGVVPEEFADQIAMDEQTIVAAYGWANGPGLLNAGWGWLGFPYLAELTQRPEYRRGSEIIAKTLTRKWIKLKAIGKADKADKIRLLDDAMKR
jgi:hypothetical protein